MTIKHEIINVQIAEAQELHDLLASTISTHLGIPDDKRPSPQQLGLIMFTLTRLIVSTMAISDPLGKAREKNITEVIRMIQDLSKRNLTAILAHLQRQAAGQTKQ